MRGGPAFHVAALTMGLCVPVNAAGQGPETAVEIVESSPPYATWSVGRAPAVQLGTVMQGDTDLQFSDIRFAAELSDGQIVVVDGASSEVRWFNEAGTLNSRAGGQGEGPGEFTRVEAGAVLEGDTLVVFDSRNERLTWFSSEGVLARTQRLALGSSLGATLHDVGSGRLLVGAEGLTPNIGGSEYNYAQDSVFAVLASSQAEPDTVLRLAGKQSVTWVNYVDGAPRGMRQMELPFGRTTWVGSLGGGSFTVESGNGELLFFGPDGSPIRSAHRTDVEPTLVSSALRRQYATAETERAIAAGAPPTMAREGAEERLGLLPDDQTVPVYDRMVVDRVGERIWLRDFVPPWSLDDASVWTVHDRRGQVRARLETPADFDLMYIAGNRVVGVTRDELGVEFVSVYEVVPPPPAR